MKLTAYERQNIALQIRQAETAIAQAKMRLRKDEVNNCDHDWKNEGYENGHNGDWEEGWQCTKCQYHIGWKPKEVEHM